MKATDTLIAFARKNGCSDIHLSDDGSIMFRKNGKLISGEHCFEADFSSKVMAELSAQSEKSENEKDLSYRSEDGYRVRIHIYVQQGKYACAIRVFPRSIPTLSDLGLPEEVGALAKSRQGLVIVTGATGSGKTTTLAAMINAINHASAAHIITLEDPIEYEFHNEKSLIRQRLIGSDTKDYHTGLRAALREDPDVIMIGEMRDHETIAAAVTAAETGHLVFSTLHTAGAAKTVSRMIDVFPSERQNQMRLQIAENLRGIIYQQLIPRKDGNGRVALCEVLRVTPPIRNLIRENKLHQIDQMMELGRKDGMLTLRAHAENLIESGIIDENAVKELKNMN